MALTNLSLLYWLHPARVPKPLRGWVIPVLLFTWWWAAYRFGWSDSELFVPISKVLDTGWRMSSSGELWHSLGASLYRMSAGFVLGSLAGFVVGALLGVSRGFERLIGPSFHTIKQVSLLAWIPLISVWFGLGDPAKIAFLSLAAFFPVVLNTFEGIRGVVHEHVEVGRVFAYSRWQVFSRVVLPSATPSIFTGVYLALIYAWLATLGAEYLLTSGAGIGNLLVDGREHFWMDQVLLGVLVVGLVGFVLNWSAGKVEARLLRWRGRSVARF
ncbi:ABC transporter permease [Chitiniphilus purpureus]|uniref:ABC transporter permease n=1 Tax=Chitiniphilus purpureus TaxID=2981137 RepID=A0ABY6DNW3_9NEIS|nr:ABC transporter permease [Chitiniphilus sp. CD1]UXY16051.1 ABC transporter permease [Chitiniphilus sp. CD1]